MKPQIISCIVFLLMISCKREDLYEPGTPSQTVVRILLHDNYLPSSKIDSAFVLWNVNGTSISKKLKVNEPYMQANLLHPAAGTGKLVFKIFSNNSLNNRSIMYERTVHTELKAGTTYTVTAPNFLQDVNWNPRIILKHDNANSLFNGTAIVGIRPNDPYFELLKIDPMWRQRIVVERSYYHTSNLGLKLAGGKWECINNNCTDSNGNYLNNTYFNFLPQQLDNRSWNRFELILRFYNSATTAAELEFASNF